MWVCQRFWNVLALWLNFLDSLCHRNFSKEFSSIAILKSPMKMKLYVLLCSSVSRFKHSRCLEIEFLWGLYKQFKNHFLFLKLNSKERLSVLHCDLHCNKRDGMSSLIYYRRPPPLSFLWYLYGEVKAILNGRKGMNHSVSSQK